MEDRRKSPRLRCRLPCQLQHGSARGEGTLIDLSEGGLCVHSELGVDQGETIQVSFDLPRAGAISLEALAWHVRRVRDRGGRQFFALGLMIASAPEHYLAALAKSPPPAARRSAPAKPAGASDEGADLLSFRIRLKARGGPRTRTVCVSALSADEARSLAVGELAGEWDVLEVQGG